MRQRLEMLVRLVSGRIRVSRAVWGDRKTGEDWIGGWFVLGFRRYRAAVRWFLGGLER